MKRIVFVKNQVLFITRDMVDTYLSRRVARGAAALAYHLTITVFPLLICISAILANLNISEQSLFILFEGVIPEGAFRIIVDFLEYVRGNRSTLMIVFGIVVMITSSSSAFNSIIVSMGVIQGEMRYKGIWGAIFSFVVSISFLIAIYASALVVISGEWLMQILEIQFGFGEILSLWQWTRFVLLFLILFGIIFSIYAISAPKDKKNFYSLPGALAASVILVAVSMIYSKMITASIRYALVYGSLASFIVMMVWLYTCGLIVIMGNVFNISLRKSAEKFGSKGTA